jgi:hypothetical protein
MRKLITFIIGVMLLSSCYKEDIVPQQPLPPQPIITNPTLNDTTVTLKNTTWVITKVLNTGFDAETTSDTLVFLTNNTYSFNGVQSTYSFYPNNKNYTLTLNNTPWGHISGDIFEHNITEGIILNCQFRDYFTGQNVVKLWLVKE